jgi:sugar lactone lactonase YvrE
MFLETAANAARVSTCLMTALFISAGCSNPAPRADWVYYPAPPAPPRAVHLKSFNALDAIVPHAARGWAALSGSKSSGGFVGSPLGIAYADGHLYICDTALHCVHDWDLGTGESRRIVGKEDGFLQTPTAVAVSDDGRLFVADPGRGEVVELAPDGSLTRSIKARDGFRPVALALCKLQAGVCGSDDLLVADAAAGAVDAISMSEGSLQYSLNLSAAKGGLPMGVTTNQVGGSTESHVYVSDMVGGRVLGFDHQGQLDRQIAQRGDRYGDMGQPRGIAFDGDGVLYVADPEFGRVHLFNAIGQLLMLLGGPEPDVGATPFPVSVAVTEDVPETIRGLVPAGFSAKTFLFVSNSIGAKRINLFAIGEATP